MKWLEGIDSNDKRVLISVNKIDHVSFTHFDDHDSIKYFTVVVTPEIHFRDKFYENKDEALARYHIFKELLENA